MTARDDLLRLLKLVPRDALDALYDPGLSRDEIASMILTLHRRELADMLHKIPAGELRGENPQLLHYARFGVNQAARKIYPGIAPAEERR